MKKIIYILAFLIAAVNINAQLSDGGTPQTYNNDQLKSSVEINQTKLRKLNHKKLNRQDAKQKVSNRYSIYKEVNINIKSKGTVLTTPSGKLWQYKVISKNGFSIGLIFSRYYVPEGAKLFIFNKQKEIIYGAFTKANNKSYKSLTIADFPANELIIEYFEPNGAEFSGEVVLGKIGQSYRNPIASHLKDSKTEFDINCPEGDNVQLEKHAVAKMTFEVNGSGFLCSGALINNTRNDATPYFLTAYHCFSTTSTAQTLITYFNHERDDCKGQTINSKNLSGSIIKAFNEPSDMLLLLLEEEPRAEHKPFFAGWNSKSDTEVESGTGIHHPGGRVKKVSLTFDEIASHGASIRWNNNSISPPNSHWILSYNEGFTEGGSSGSPLLDNNNRIIGQLHGGSESYDFYGKLSTSWDKAKLASNWLKTYLDPDNTNKKELNGHSPATNYPEAHFTAEYQNVCTGGEVKLTDNSIFSPSSWSWDIQPGTINYLNGTTGDSRNPEVRFLENAAYTISLNVSNAASNHTRIRRNYILSGNTITPEIRPSEELYLCHNSLTSQTLYATGADSFNWRVIDGSKYIIIDSNTIETNALKFSKNNLISLDSNVTVKVHLIGNHHTCTDTTEKTVYIQSSANDNISNAISLELGRNGVYSNRCATIELNEPSPLDGECNSQEKWCECGNTPTILDNSVWFSFDGPASGIVGIDAPGFDNQIAVYEAASYTDILSGDPTKYKLLAANDDYLPKDPDFSALIEEIKVTPNQKYWLQVDGSACGMVGEFEILLYDYTIKDTTSSVESAVINNSVLVYPNPASDFLYITNLNLPNPRVSIISMDGKYYQDLTITESGNGLTIALPKNLSDGIYIVQIAGKRQSIQQKISVFNFK